MARIVPCEALIGLWYFASAAETVASFGSELEKNGTTGAKTTWQLMRALFVSCIRRPIVS